jgi:hypothetical protein
MTNRIGGDFGAEAIEAFRAAYAQQLLSPDSDEVANNSGLPTNTIANTSPWYEGVGLWKYPSGKGPEENLKQPFNLNDYLSEEVVDGDGEIEEMGDDDLESLVDEITGEFDAD